MAAKRTAVLFGAKSTDDVHGSIPTQLADGRDLAECEGLEVVAEYQDEAASAYKGNRGAGLAAAIAHCERLAAEHGEAALIVQHSDRLARGDGKHAKHLLHYGLWAVENDVRLLSVQDPQTFGDLLYMAVTGQRNNEDSKRKGAAVKAGQRRRFESGKRLGSPIRDGYKHPLIEVARDGRPVREPVIDPERAPIIRRIFEMVEKGHTYGEVREALNAEGIRTKRGEPWTTRKVRHIIRDDWFAGRARSKHGTIESDHDALIEPDRWERIAAMVASEPRTRSVKNPPRDWLLQGIASCGLCGSTLYTRSDRHTYVCKSVRESRGTCDALPIPAETAEQLVLDHLHDFVGDVEEWLSGQARAAVNERDQFAKSLEAQRVEQRKLSVKVEKAREQWERHLGEDDDAADAALRGASRLEGEAEHLADVIASMETRLAEWPTAPDVDAALDSYSELRDAVQGRLSGSKTVSELRAHLRATLAEARLDYRDGNLFGDFTLRHEVWPGQQLSGLLASGPVLDPVVIDNPGREAANTTS
jgi:DNA invertase Pin-like site-specific DNA recombinase